MYICICAEIHALFIICNECSLFKALLCTSYFFILWKLYICCLFVCVCVYKSLLWIMWTLMLYIKFIEIHWKKKLPSGFDFHLLVHQLILGASDKEQCDCSCLECFRVVYNTHLIFHPHFPMQHQFQFSLSGPIYSVPQGASSRAVSLRGVTLSWTGRRENNC